MSAKAGELILNYTLNFIKKYILYTNFISIQNRTQKQWEKKISTKDKIQPLPIPYLG